MDRVLSGVFFPRFALSAIPCKSARCHRHVRGRKRTLCDRVTRYDAANSILVRFRPNYNTLYLHTLNFHFSLSLYFHFRKCRKTFLRFKRFSLIYRDVTLFICTYADMQYVDANTSEDAHIAIILVRISSKKKNWQLVQVHSRCYQSLETPDAAILASSVANISQRLTYIRPPLLKLSTQLKSSS